MRATDGIYWADAAVQGHAPTKSTKNSTKRVASPAHQCGGAHLTGTDARVTTTSGYVDIWAGLMLTGKQFFPLARRLFARQHPKCTSQHAIHEPACD